MGTRCCARSVLLAVPALAVLASGCRPGPTPTTTPPELIAPLVTPSPIATATQVPGTYRDETHGYVVSYPADFTVYDWALSEGKLWLASEPVGQPMALSDQGIWISVESEPRNGRTLGQWLAATPVPAGRVISGLRDLTVDGAPARRQVEDDMAAIDIGVGFAVATYVEGPEWLYSIVAITKHPAAFQHNEAVYEEVVRRFDILNH